MANDHYVPQFYLKNFEISTRPKWVYSYKRNLKPIPKAIKSVACEDNFDLLKSDRKILDEDFISNILKQTEDDAAPVLKNLVTTSDLNLFQEEYKFLAVFVAYLMHRNPNSREKMANLHKAFDIAQLKLVAEDKAKFQEYVQERGLDNSSEELEELRQQILHFEQHYRLR